jgi:hypothetical protein
MTATMTRLPDLDSGTGVPQSAPDAGHHGECAFPGSTEAEGTCREIPVATISESCPNGHMGLLRACTGHAAEVAGWDGSFIGTEDSPGTLTCPQCHDAGNRAVALQVSLFWDDMRAEILQ